MSQTAAVFIGIKGTVVALDRATGQEVWCVGLTGSDFVNVAVEEGAVLAATKGELFCLDPATGQIRWHNPLKGLGRGLITIASPGGQGTAVVREKQRRDAEKAAIIAGAAGASGH